MMMRVCVCARACVHVLCMRGRVRARNERVSAARAIIHRERERERERIGTRNDGIEEL